VPDTSENPLIPVALMFALGSQITPMLADMLREQTAQQVICDKPDQSPDHGFALGHGQAREPTEEPKRKCRLQTRTAPALAANEVHPAHRN